MKKIFITGCLGFIGSHLSEYFLKKGYLVFGIDDLSNKYSSKLYQFTLNSLKKSKEFRFKKISILDTDTVNLFISQIKPDYFIHCAAKVGVRDSVDNPGLYYNINVKGTKNLLDAILKNDPKTKTILFSSSSVYGDNKIPFSENMKPKPLSPYGISKYQMEKLARQYVVKHNLNLVIIRAFSVFGPRGRVDMLPFLLFKHNLTGKPFTIFGTNENNLRDWTYIDDFVEGINKIIQKWPKDFEVFNIGHGQSIGIEDFVKYYLSFLKKYSKNNLKIIHKPRKGIESSVTLADISKAEKMIGFTPKVSWKEGLKKTVKYFCKNQSLYFND